MDLLRSLIVPPPLVSAPTNAPSEGPKRLHHTVATSDQAFNDLLQSLIVPPPIVSAPTNVPSEGLQRLHHTVATSNQTLNDLLRSLTVPPAIGSIPTNVPSEFPQILHYPVATSGQAFDGSLLPNPLAEPTSHSVEQYGSANVFTKKKKTKHNHKQKQARPEESKPSKAPVLTSPAAITKAPRRRRQHLFHPDRPKTGPNTRAVVSYEDLYDDLSAKQPKSPSVDSQDQSLSKTNPESTQTCFFWYHGSCKRSQDKQGCQFRHALLDPPGMVVAPPRFVHPRPCGLEWCGGDGPRKGQQAQQGTEQKRYFEAAVAGDTPARDNEGKISDEDWEFFLKGFEEPDA